jgi:hypothetical protein
MKIRFEDSEGLFDFTPSFKRGKLFSWSCVSGRMMLMNGEGGIEERNFFDVIGRLQGFVTGALGS